MFKKILLRTVAVIVVLIVGFLVIVWLQPSSFRVERSAVFNAPAEVVFAQVNDFHNWDAWSPWAKLDPNSTMTFEGSSSGTGAVFKWSGNDQVGEGMMTLIESQPHELIRIKLDFVRPFEDTANTVFRFEPQGEQTKITWTMSGENNFIGRVFCVFMNMDAMIGGDFEKGLANMKAVVESAKQ